MAIVTGDRYLESLVKFVENHAEPLIEGTLVLKLNPVGLRYVQSRLEALEELESLLAGAPVDYLRAYVSDLGDHRAIEQLRRILRLLPSLKVVSVLPPLAGRDPTPLYLLPFGRLKVLELRGCDLSTSAAKGLLELRFTLEKFICHNSTDALRHVFASRIVEIKDSPQWNRLSFVSCACNGLVLMDESLQLLPVVETLDLSRNKFAKANNLRRCTKLRHLDLGFNGLRSIQSFSEVSSRVVKLVLRNNAITTLRGIENMKSLEGLDVSYNIISSFSEVEILAGLPSLQDLWLEGNPICYARWFRSQVFSVFSHPEKLMLDEKRISASEFWQRQIIVASRQKQPASFGFYSPLKDDADLKGSIDTKRKRISRLVSIDSEEPRTSIYSDQDSGSFDINENQSKDENTAADNVAEIEDMIKRIEFMKKERSDLWLEEFKEWMNHTSDNIVDGSKFRSCVYNEKNHLKCEAPDENLGETSRYISDSIQFSGDESSTVILESETSFADVSTVVSTQHYLDRIGEASSKFPTGHEAADTSTAKESDTTQEVCGSIKNGGPVAVAGDACLNSLAVANRVNVKNVIPPSAAINDIIGSSSSSACPGSPPHYQDDILHRRQNLEEEFLQLSAESISVASSDSITSCSEDDSAEFGPSVAQTDQYVIDNLSVRSERNFHYQGDAGDPYHDRISLLKQNGGRPLGPAVGNFIDTDAREVDMSTDVYCDSFPDAVHGDEITSFRDEETDWLEKKKHRRKPRRRMVSLPEEDDAHGDTDSSKKPIDYVEISRSDVKGEGNDVCPTNCLLKSIPVDNNEDSTKLTVVGNCHSGNCSRIPKSNDDKADFVESFFNSNMADCGVNEVSTLYMHCDCLFLDKSGYKEREVAVLRSSEHKLYILLSVRACAGTSLEIVGCHRADDVRDVFVGLGLLCLRVYFEGNTTYLFITRCLERSRELLCVLDLFDSSGVKDYCSLMSLEHIQINLFEEHVCGGCKINIFQYSMVLFWHSNLQEDMWLSRSLFLLERHLLVCAEDLTQFGTTGNSLSACYFSLDSCCAVGDISELVIDTTLDGMCVSLAFECTSECLPWEEGDAVERKSAFGNRNQIGDRLTWELKWYSKESLLNFVALLKAIHGQSTSSSLLVRCVS